ncbi:unnamed protein product [Cuscuta campestris]|uniref:WRKY domain-containing protein n=1 Tax=Cuscuta campestris TaxID=132261 RepID=A0A484LLY2_9ASTE|nr:unnamed protein product [Cuscuta campestris]
MTIIRRLIQHGIELAKDLEVNLGNRSISQACEEIIRVFSRARERSLLQRPPAAGSGGGSNVQSWVMSTDTAGQAVLDLLFLPRVGEQTPAVGPRRSTPPLPVGGSPSAVRDVDVSESSRGLSSSLQSQRRRREEKERFTVNVAAPQMGNLDLPPDDGYTWRKYGQKDILGSSFPRAYYRCTHQRLYDCPAKKQVQRVDDNPYIFKVTYRYRHTCHMSATAPSAPPAVGGALLQHQSTTTARQPPHDGRSSGGSWLTMNIKTRPSPEGGSTSNNTMLPHQMHRDYAAPAASSDAAGPSTTAGTMDVDFGGQPVVDMADVMFNSGSSSEHSIDFIFHTIHTSKYEQRENN